MLLTTPESIATMQKTLSTINTLRKVANKHSRTVNAETIAELDKASQSLESLLSTAKE